MLHIAYEAAPWKLMPLHHLSSRYTFISSVNTPAASSGFEEEEQIFRGVCRPNCFGFCHMNVHVRNGHVVKTSRAPYYHDPHYTRICQRGLSHVQRINDPERLKYPLRRVEGTERGAGQWERITWDEAIDEVAGHIEDVQGEFGPQALAVYNISGNYGQLTLGFLIFFLGLKFLPLQPAESEK